MNDKVFFSLHLFILSFRLPLSLFFLKSTMSYIMKNTCKDNFVKGKRLFIREIRRTKERLFTSVCVFVYWRSVWLVHITFESRLTSRYFVLVVRIARLLSISRHITQLQSERKRYSNKKCYCEWKLSLYVLAACNTLFSAKEGIMRWLENYYDIYVVAVLCCVGCDNSCV